MTTNRKSLGALALVVALFGLGVAFDGDETPAAPTAPVVREVTNFDFTSHAANEDIVIHWSEFGCFHSSAFVVRIAGDNSGEAVVYVLNPQSAFVPRKSVTALIPSAAEIETSGTFTLNASERAGVAGWLARLRGAGQGGCTSQINLDFYRVAPGAAGELIDHESFVDDWCRGTCDWANALTAYVSSLR
jgi:hypothetical protein